MVQALAPKYSIDIMSVDDIRDQKFLSYDCIAFPGGIGDYSSFDQFFRRKTQNAVADYVANGGHYLGICMGAYWAGSHWFDILDGVDTEQYIRRPRAEIRRPYGTTAQVKWNRKTELMFFYDGCAMVGDATKFKTVAHYLNHDPMAIIQNRVGIIGCHPESMEFWYEKPYQYINKHWHHGHHHNLLLEFVDELMLN